MKGRTGILLAAVSAGLILTAALAYRGHPEATGRDEASTSTDIHSSKTARPEETGATKKEIREKARVWKEHLLAARPDMKVEFREVADKDNGFLQWLDFMDECRSNGKIGPVGAELILPDDVAGMLEEDGEWNATRFGEWAKENAAFLERIISLGLLPDQSARGIDSMRIAETRALPGNLGQVLLAVARHDLEAGNGPAAVRTLESMMGSARQVEGIETPTYLHMVEAAGLRAKLLAFAEGEGAGSADMETLRSLREIISTEGNEPAGFANFARGDWHVCSDTLLLPTLLKGEATPDFPTGLLKQPELVANTVADASAATARQMETATLRELLAAASPPKLNLPADVPADTRAALEQICYGLTSGLSKGWAMQQVQRGLADAALAITLGEEVPVEPVTGLPYVIDEASGMLKLPDDPLFSDVPIEPRKIPRVVAGK